MITIAKLDHQGKIKLRYEGELIARDERCAVVRAKWSLPARDLGYTRFEPGDQFIEYYYTDRWYNIFDISGSDGIHKGWYCNIAEPAQISKQHIAQVDLYLDVWITTTGTSQILDEDEFAAASLTDLQQSGARQGLQALLQVLAARQEPFTRLAALQ